MCGRYVWQPKDLEALQERFLLQESKAKLLEIDACFNVAPGFKEPVIVKNSPNHIELMVWGLIPPWAKDIKIGYKMINARSETILEKVSFKRPFKSKRCIIPISGFYEWKATESGKIPYYIYPPDASYWGLAGLYEEHPGTEGKTIKSFTIITCAPNDFMKDIHIRMPVILHQKDYEIWLNNSEYNEQQLLDMLRPYEGEMEKRRVSDRVNSVRNQEETLADPL